MSERRLRIFTWHIHGSYLYYLSQGNYDVFIPVDEAGTAGHGGKGTTFPFGSNLHEIQVDDIASASFDVILYQSKQNYLVDQYRILTQEQLRLPRVYLEHDPPQEHPTETKHVVDDPEVMVVHVTHFNKLMWNNQGPVKVVEHGVIVPPVKYKGDFDKGVVVINNPLKRGRRLGWDIVEEVRKKIPLDVVGMGTETVGSGEVMHPDLPEFLSHYRFFFNPIRFTSLGLAICEAMMLGLPIVGLATTELVTVVRNGVNGFIHTDTDYLIDKMNLLLTNPELAQDMGGQARLTANERFNIQRFVADWENVFSFVVRRNMQPYLKSTL